MASLLGTPVRVRVAARAEAEHRRGLIATVGSQKGPLHLTCPSEAVVTASLKLTEQKPPPAAAAAARHRLKGEITGALSSWITYIFLEIGVGRTWMRCNFAARIVPFFT
jgi:hypothetical protein